MVKKTLESDPSPVVEPVPETGGLESPILLVAMPQVQDPFFNMSVVLLIHHQDEGSLGFIVNRPTGVPISKILEGLEIEWQGSDGQTAYFGGPVQPQLGTVICRTADAPGVGGSHQEIGPGIVLTQNIRDLEHLAEKPPGDLRLFLGYAGWGEGQLIEEFLRNDWITVPVDADIVFGSDPNATWRAALAAVGIDAARLSSSMPMSGDGSVAN